MDFKYSIFLNGEFETVVDHVLFSKVVFGLIRTFKDDLKVSYYDDCICFDVYYEGVFFRMAICYYVNN